MKKTSALALLAVLPSLAAAAAAPPLSDLKLDSPPFTLVANALDQQPTFDFAPRLPAPVPTYVDRMPVIVPGAQADLKMLHQPDPSVDYKLTVLDPTTGDGK